MSAYHLHARQVVGPLGAFARNETRAATAESWPDIQEAARSLAGCGFTVWIYEHGTHVFPTASDLRLVLRLDPAR